MKIKQILKIMIDESDNVIFINIYLYIYLYLNFIFIGILHE